MISAPAPVVKIRLMDDFALVPSSKGDGCYHVSIEDGAAIHCTCPDHRRRSRTCKHMDAVDAILVGARPCVGADLYTSELTPKTSKARKADPKPAAAPKAAAPVVGALAKVAAEVELLRSQMTPASVAALDDEERADAMADALGDEARDEATDADWDASYYYW